MSWGSSFQTIHRSLMPSSAISACKKHTFGIGSNELSVCINISAVIGGPLSKIGLVFPTLCGALED